MREIKFRAWDKAGKNMRHDFQWMTTKDPHMMGGKVIRIQHLINGRNISSGAGASVNFEIMQYTGLKDKNNAEIYEGDIVLCRVTIQVPDDTKDFSYFNSHEDGSKTKHCCKPKPCQVLINNGCVEYAHKTGKSCSSFLTKSHEVEVIGNIYENEDLLK